jgi:hypothetical protein
VSNSRKISENDPKALVKLSPYPRQLKHYGDIAIDMETIPQPYEIAINLPLEIAETKRQKDSQR